MTKNFVGLYHSFEDAQKVVRELVNSGFSREQISLIANDARGQSQHLTSTKTESMEDSDVAKGAGVGAALGGLGGLLVGLGALAIPGIGPVVAAGPLVAALGGAGLGAATGGLIGALTDTGIPEEQAHLYAEGVRRGDTLVILQSPDHLTDRALQIMSRYNPIDIRQRQAMYQKENWRRFDESAKPYTSEQLDKINIPIIEEEMKVGKRETNQGVRINTYITERPFEQDVTLRQERVDVERRPANRPASQEDLNAFKEGTMEVHAKSEEPVVSKESRVVEDVEISKDVTQRTEKIQDTLKRTDVNVENMETGTRTSGLNFDTLEPRFRSHYDRYYSRSNMGYTDYRKAYRFGFDAGMNDRYRNRNWDQIQSDLRRDWESRHHDSAWEEFKDAVHAGWEEIIQQR